MGREKLSSIIQEFKAGIKKFAGADFKKVILLGSFARGDAEEGSDIDLVLIFKNKISSEMTQKISELSNLLSLKHDVVISEFIFTEEDFEKGRTSFLINVKKEGIEV